MDSDIWIWYIHAWAPNISWLDIKFMTYDGMHVQLIYTRCQRIINSLIESNCLIVHSWLQLYELFCMNKRHDECDHESFTTLHSSLGSFSLYKAAKFSSLFTMIRFHSCALNCTSWAAAKPQSFLSIFAHHHRIFIIRTTGNHFTDMLTH